MRLNQPARLFPISLFALFAASGCRTDITVPHDFCVLYASTKADFEVRCLNLDESLKADASRAYAAECLRRQDAFCRAGASLDRSRAQGCLNQLIGAGCFDRYAKCFREWDGSIAKYGPAFWCNAANAAQDPVDCAPELGVGAPTEWPNDPERDSLGEGASCGRKFSCDGQHYCRGLKTVSGPPAAPLLQTVIPGVCAPKIALGQPCIDEQVDDGCDGERATCLDGVCTETPPYSRSEGQSCDQPDQCLAELACSRKLASPDDGRCEHPTAPKNVAACTSLGCFSDGLLEAGAPCTPYQSPMCGEGICRGSSLSAPFTCGAPLSDGETCAAPDGSDCKSMRCEPPCPGGCADGTPSRCLSRCG